MFDFYTPWKHQKTLGFLIFSGVVKVERWLKIGWQKSLVYARLANSFITLKSSKDIPLHWGWLNQFRWLFNSFMTEAVII